MKVLENICGFVFFAAIAAVLGGHIGLGIFIGLAVYGWYKK